MESNISPLLVSLRALLTENNLDAYIIPRTDPHDVYFLSYSLLNTIRVNSYLLVMKDSSSLQVLADPMELLL